MKLLSKDGIEMMEIRSVVREADVLVVKGKVMGSIATTIHLRPEELWQAYRLLSWRILLALPLLMLKGYQRSRT
jgi:hypothetical protein